MDQADALADTLEPDTTDWDYSAEVVKHPVDEIGDKE